jgi:UDP-4-amino-4,6-dideoxy-N-acetyl-beta-L-altrosamine transaminase
MIPYGRQSISEEDIEAVVDVLRSDWLTHGPMVGHFEDDVASRCDVAHAVAVSNGTAALHLACLALGLGAGDSLWTSPNTFVASANCALYCGAAVDFVDIDPLTYNLCVDALEQKLRTAKLEGRLPKIVVPVHFGGRSCDMTRIRALSREYGFYVIEDACHALGSNYKDAPVGSCRYSDLTVFSFHPVKSITTGEGGMVTTNDHGLYEKLNLLRSHGITRDPDKFQGEAHGSWYYEQISLGFNFRLSDLQAALGLSQLKRLGEFMQRRRHLARRYDQALDGLPLVLPWQASDCVSAFHLYPVQVSQASQLSRGDVLSKLREHDIHVGVHYMPIHTQPYYREMGFSQGDYPNAEHYYANTLSLPLYPELTDIQQDEVIAALQTIFN